jgi:PadR family transcriptional regulator, regulatory protein AphA
MSLEYAILGFLSYKPFSGYDLKKVFDSSVKHFWYADQSQIYRTLTRLTEEGLADVEIVEQTDRPDRKVYHITPKGRTELNNWLKGPFPVQQAHSGPLVQVFFAGQLTDEEILSKFEEAAAIFRAILETYTEVPGKIVEISQMVDSRREAFFWTLTLELGMRTMQAQLEWAESVIQRVRNKQHPAETGESKNMELI